ncbi:uncharacterized protein LOC115891355 [Sitophilus oryzae]|uniref:Uncharacterized protein LOC115891355 n=1 Tax=Sitophilus oryzae TaxID=7048 RepID=A0A6J2YWL6_SITOR|nr:uncharacterized protein LOC115891355 [Sitophilus oryzae]
MGDFNTKIGRGRVVDVIGEHGLGQQELQTSHSRDKGDINIEWEKIKDTILEIGNKELGCKNEKKKNEWMTDEIIELMRLRREAKTTENNRYKSIHREIQKKVKETKEHWLNEKCTEIEQLQKVHDSFNIHKKVKEITGNYKKRNTTGGR